MLIRLRRVGDSVWTMYEMDSGSGQDPTPNEPDIPPSQEPVDAFDMSQAIQHEGDFRNWPATTKLKSIIFGDGGLNVDFTKRNDDSNKENTWPDVIPSGWDGPIYYSLGMAMYIEGAWHVAAPVQCWRQDMPFGGPIYSGDQVKRNWFYSNSRWGVMNRQPQAGELVGFFVIAGSVRLGSEAVAVRERSNVITIPFPSNPTVWRG